jgi:hypothetical protein
MCNIWPEDRIIVFSGIWRGQGTVGSPFGIAADGSQGFLLARDAVITIDGDLKGEGEGREDCAVCHHLYEKIKIMIIIVTEHCL